jgi:hypothetical protein
MRLLLTIGSLAFAAPLAAQDRPLPVPHPAPLLWASGSTPLSYPTDTVRATTGAGPGTWIGAGVGAAGGWFLTGAGCALAERTTCGFPQLIGLLLGGLSGAMVGSALEGDQPKP